jgi:phage terminase large subunit
MPKSILDEQRLVDRDTGEVFDITKNVSIQPEVSLAETAPQYINVSHIQHCPRCNKPLVSAKAVNGSESSTFKECPECGTLINTFKPTAYQAMFLRRRERYKMTAGGYGSGKSRANIEDVIKHIMLIPGARVAVTARTYPALEATFVKEFYSIFPMKLIRRKNDQKHELQLTNGSEILFRSFDDETKLKSINLTMAVIVESSDVNFAAFTMLQSRIRNTNAMIPEVDSNGEPVMQWDPNQQIFKPKYRIDARHINLETNPDSGWVKSKFLLDSGTVEFYGDAYNEGYKYNKDRDPQKYTQIISTSANPYLPATYEEEQTRGKSKAYVQQYYKGSFNFSSNLVFPNFGVCIVAPHPLPRAFNESGKRVLYYAIGVDYGINDPTHVVYAAFSTETKKLYVYDELRINNSDIKTLAKEYRKETKLNGTDLDGLLMQPRFDGRSYSKRESNLVTIGSMFEAEGLYFEPSFASHDARIIKMNSLLNHNQIEVFSTCEFLIDEALNYKFKLDKNGTATDKPEDGNDHGITALEFVVVELPHNLQELKLNVYLPNGKSFVHDKQKNAIIKKTSQYYDPLKENTNDGNSDSFSNNLTYTGNDRVIFATSIFNEDVEETDEEDFNKPLGAWLPK